MNDITLLLLTSFVIIIILVVIIIKRKNVFSEIEPTIKNEPTKYYSLQSALNEYEKQLNTVRNYVNKCKAQLEEIKKHNEELMSIRLKITENKVYSAIIPAVSQNLLLLEKCKKSMHKTNDIDVLYCQYKSGLELIRWFITKEICFPDAAAYILEGGAENYLNSFKEKYNEIICRVAGFHFVHYKSKFYSLYTLSAQQTHTQKIFVTLDTLREMIDTDVSNSDFVSENLNNYHSQVEDLFANI